MTSILRSAWCAALSLSLLTTTSHGQAGDPGAPGPFNAGQRSVTVTRPNSTTFPAQVYYPATTSGLNAPLNASGAPYPVITFGHGFLQPVERYQSTLEHLATWGFLVIASESNLGLFPSHSGFAADLSQSLTWLEEQHAQPGSFFTGVVDVGAYGASGHSMGGGCSILAAASDPRIRAVANLAAANTNPSAVAAMPAVQIPISLIAGSSDSITPVANHGQLMYAAGDWPRQLPLIQGGWHCGFQDFSTFGCDSGPLARAEQLLLTRRLLTSFFRLYLKDDQSMWPLVWGPDAAADPRITTTSQSNIAVLPAAPQASNFGGREAELLIEIRNLGPEPSVFAIEVSGLTWPVALTPSQTPTIAPSGSSSVTVRASIPAGYPAASRAAVVSARSLVDGGTRAWASVQFKRLCRADLDRNGLLNIEDFLAMVNLFAAGSPDADIDNNGLLNIEDFLAFVNAYATGCE